MNLTNGADIIWPILVNKAMAGRGVDGMVCVPFPDFWQIFLADRLAKYRYQKVQLISVRKRSIGKTTHQASEGVLTHLHIQVDRLRYRSTHSIPRQRSVDVYNAPVVTQYSYEPSRTADFQRKIVEMLWRYL